MRSVRRSSGRLRPSKWWSPPTTTPEKAERQLDHVWGYVDRTAAAAHDTNICVAAAQTDVLLRYLNVRCILNRTELHFIPRLEQNAWFHRSKHLVEVGAHPFAASALTHEIGHMIDYGQYTGGGECMRGGDSWGSARDGCLHTLAVAARDAWKPDAGPLLDFTVRQRLRVLPASVVRRLDAGITLDEATGLILKRAGVTHGRLDAANYTMPFGGFDARRYAADQDVPLAVAVVVAYAAQLLPVGVPISLYDKSVKERERYMETLQRARIENAVRGYYLSLQEVFARLFDQAVRTRAVREGVWAGSQAHTADLSRKAFRELEPTFWKTMRDVGLSS